MVSLYLMEILGASQSPSPVLNMAAAIVFFRKAMNGEEMGLSVEVHIMREIARRSFGDRQIKRAKVIGLELARA